MLYKVKKIINGWWKWLFLLLIPIAFAAVPLELPSTQIRDVLGNRQVTLFERDENGLPIPGTAYSATQYAYVAGRMDESYPSKLNGENIISEILEKRTAHSRTFRTDKKNVFVTKAIAGASQYYKDTKGLWWQVDYATTTVEVPVLKHTFGFVKKVFASHGNDFSGAGDGQVHKADSQDWDATHDATTGGTADDTSDADVAAFVSFYGANFYRINRAFYPVDTSAIPAGDTIDSATFNVYVANTSNADNDGDDFIRLVQTDQPDNTTLTTSDYNNCGATDNPTAGATDLDITDDITDGVYNVWTLNATGLGWIKKSGESSPCGSALTGWTCLGQREGHDVIDSAIAGTPSVNSGFISARFSEFTGTDSDPYLAVTHSSARNRVIIIQ